MKKLVLIAVSFGALGFAASADTVDFHRAKNSQAVPAKSIPDRPVMAGNPANAGFGDALEQLMVKRSGSVVDPSGKFAIHVMPDGAGEVIRLVPVQGGAQVREWKLGSGAGDLVVSATIAELMTATGQQPQTQLTSAVAVQPLTGQLKH